MTNEVNLGGRGRALKAPKEKEVHQHKKPGNKDGTLSPTGPTCRLSRKRMFWIKKRRKKSQDIDSSSQRRGVGQHSSHPGPTIRETGQ